mmetsp:Transcript_30414/g.58084  ORF Transcript_30414/g.58084 Transcript_30414/m.58084 type:complete len:1179 (-) Transcript_30414:121-3657(-)
MELKYVTIKKMTMAASIKHQHQHQKQRQLVTKIKHDLHNATLEAYQSMVSSNETILGNPFSSSDDAGADSSDAASSNNTHDDDRTGTDLGLALFGTSEEYKEDTEREYVEKLSRLERELAEIRDGLSSLNQTRGPSGGDGDDPDDDDLGDPLRGSSSGKCRQANGDDGNEDIDEEYSKDQILFLDTHTRFLRECSRARKMLNDVDVLSLTNFATSAGGAQRSGSGGKIDGGAVRSPVTFPFSPSHSVFSPGSVLTPSQFTFHDGSFGTTGKGQEKDDGESPSPMVQAAMLLSEIDSILDVVAQLMEESFANAPEKENNDVHHNSVPSTTASHPKSTQMIHQMLTVQSTIYNELKIETRRKKMELRHRAMTLLEGCILMEENRILVRGSATATGKRSDENATKHSGTPDAASSAEGSTSIAPSPLSDAYRVLELFEDHSFPSFGESLDGAMKILAAKLMNFVVRPGLTALDGGKNGLTEGTSGRTNAGSTVNYYEFREEYLANGHRQQSRGAGRRYDPVTIKGPAVQLEWDVKASSFSHNKTSSNEIHSDDSNISTSSPISVSRQINKETLSSTPSSSIGTFLSMLNFLSNIFNFIHHHVLLRRSDLATILGKHLNGSFPVKASMSAGSAVIGGVLIGTAAQGMEEGEERPLMTELLKQMRKLCVPVDSSPSIWKMMFDIQNVLIYEVEAFESRLVEMGFMDEKNSSDNGFGDDPRDDIPPKQLSSPMGLNVLVDENVLSPIHTNATASFAATPTPPTFNAENKTNSIRSPLSELAHSLLQSYMEKQRSSILNNGRSILLSTDYHNSVQVGTPVPDPAELGSLESIDEDPLLAFDLHQCSVSTTAQQILQLCRSTLDKATDNEAAEMLDDLRPMLYRASRELLDLFRAIIPTMYASEVASIPRMAAILHNDCVYLAHEVSLLGVEYKEKFRSLVPSSARELVPGKESGNELNKIQLLSDICTFVDMVPAFRDLATKTMGYMIELQKSQLYELVKPRLENFVPALSSNESVTEWDDAETALRAALYHLKHLSQSWSQVLSREVYHLSMGNLVDTVFTMFLGPVLKASEITDPASRFVHSLYLDAGRGAANLFFLGPMSTDSTSVLPMPEEKSSTVSKYAVMFNKMQAVGRFMVMRLDDIQRALGEGVFQSVTARELAHLISACFDESEKRSSLLNALASK